MEKFDGFKMTGRDQEIEERIKEHCERFVIEPLDAIKHFPVLARRQWLKRFLAHNELFLKTLEVPGDIAELGVFRGLGLMTWANLLEAYCIGDRTKTVYGFDNWNGFVKFDNEDGSQQENAYKVLGGFSCGEYLDELENAINIYDADRFIPWKDRIKLVTGNIEESVPNFVEKNPGVRFSLVHFDCDLYKPTKVALEYLWPILSRGGIMLFDEYSIPDWAGETKAVDEFIEDKPNIKLRKLQWNNVPAAYLIKE